MLRFYLGLAGDLHFDEDEQFDVNGSDSKVDLFWVSLHELGHSLGLDHSYEVESVMFPFYLGYTKGLTLHWDDVQGIQQLYGECLERINIQSIFAFLLDVDDLRPFLNVLALAHWGDTPA